MPRDPISGAKLGAIIRSQKKPGSEKPAPLVVPAPKPAFVIEPGARDMTRITASLKQSKPGRGLYTYKMSTELPKGCRVLESGNRAVSLVKDGLYMGLFLRP